MFTVQVVPIAARPPPYCNILLVVQMMCFDIKEIPFLSDRREELFLTFKVETLCVFSFFFGWGCWGVTHVYTVSVYT